MGDKIISIPHSKPSLGLLEEKAVLAVLRSGNMAHGPKVAELERAMARHAGRRYAVAVNSGVSALHLALLALGVRRGDEVILPSYTCDALLNAILYLDAKPVVTDVGYPDCNITPQAVLSAITRKTKAVIVPHAFGFPAAIDEIVRMGVPVIEDCAVSAGAKLKNRTVGGFGKIAVYSFYATKMLSAGEGGMVVTDDAKLAACVRELSDYTGHDKFSVRYNYKMTDITAAIALVQLSRLAGFIKARKILWENYRRRLSCIDGVSLPEVGARSTPSYYRFIARLIGGNVPQIQRAMAKKGVRCGRAVFVPLHRLLRLQKNRYPVSERLYRENLSLPLYPALTVRQADYLVKTFIQVMGAQ